jgi:hypothetical protein
MIMSYMNTIAITRQLCKTITVIRETFHDHFRALVVVQPPTLGVRGLSTATSSHAAPARTPWTRQRSGASLLLKQSFQSDREASVPSGDVTIRRLGKPGDLGWVVMAHGELYAAEFGWDVSFEALVARIVADCANSHDDAREAAWIAECDGRRAGCVLCTAVDMRTAQLRTLLIGQVYEADLTP